MLSGIMEKFLIAPEDCLIVRALAQNSSLRETALALKCDPASLVKKAQRISAEHGLLEKLRGRWVLTEKGRKLILWVNEAMSEQSMLLKERRQVTLTSTMWFAEQVVVPRLAHLDILTGRELAWQVKTAADEMEFELLNGQSDFVLACHAPNDPAIAHRRLAREEWCLIGPKSWSAKIRNLRSENLQSFLQDKPLVRHLDINPWQALGLSPEGPEASVVVDSLISVRSAVETGAGWSVVPRLLVLSSLKRGDLVAWSGPVAMRGDICLWWLRARRERDTSVRVLSEWLGDSLAALG